MRRLPFGVWDVDECRYDSGIGQPRVGLPLLNWLRDGVGATPK
jgi:hypothetical protein